MKSLEEITRSLELLKERMERFKGYPIIVEMLEGTYGRELELLRRCDGDLFREYKGWYLRRTEDGGKKKGVVETAYAVSSE